MIRFAEIQQRWERCGWCGRRGRKKYLWSARDFTSWGTCRQCVHPDHYLPSAPAPYAPKPSHPNDTPETP